MSTHTNTDFKNKGRNYQQYYNQQYYNPQHKFKTLSSINQRSQNLNIGYGFPPRPPTNGSTFDPKIYHQKVENNKLDLDDLYSIDTSNNQNKRESKDISEEKKKEDKHISLLTQQMKSACLSKSKIDSDEKKDASKNLLEEKIEEFEINNLAQPKVQPKVHPEDEIYYNPEIMKEITTNFDKIHYSNNQWQGEDIHSNNEEKVPEGIVVSVGPIPSGDSSDNIKHSEDSLVEPTEYSSETTTEEETCFRDVGETSLVDDDVVEIDSSDFIKISKKPTTWKERNFVSNAFLDKPELNSIESFLEDTERKFAYQMLTTLSDRGKEHIAKASGRDKKELIKNAKLIQNFSQAMIENSSRQMIAAIENSQEMIENSSQGIVVNVENNHESLIIPKMNVNIDAYLGTFEILHKLCGWSTIEKVKVLFEEFCDEMIYHKASEIEGTFLDNDVDQADILINEILLKLNAFWIEVRKTDELSSAITKDNDLEIIITIYNNASVKEFLYFLKAGVSHPDYLRDLKGYYGESTIINDKDIYKKYNMFNFLSEVSEFSKFQEFWMERKNISERLFEMSSGIKVREDLDSYSKDQFIEEFGEKDKKNYKMYLEDKSPTIWKSISNFCLAKEPKTVAIRIMDKIFKKEVPKTPEINNQLQIEHKVQNTKLLENNIQGHVSFREREPPIEEYWYL